MELFLSVGSVAQINRSPVRLWIRIHPAQSRENMEELIKNSGAMATIIGKEWPDGRPLLLAANAVFGTVTMMLQLAAFLGRPAFSCLPNLNKEDPIFPNKLGITTPLYSKVDIAKVLNSLVSRQNMGNRSNTYQLIPQATEKVCQALREMMV
jgi:predicted glycosyltransferase